MESRTKDMCGIAAQIEEMVNKYSRRDDIRIRYSLVDADNISKYSDWQRRYYGIVIGDEYFMIADHEGLLYMVNVTGDSLMTAAGELMDLAARKF